MPTSFPGNQSESSQSASPQKSTLPISHAVRYQYMLMGNVLQSKGTTDVGTGKTILFFSPTVKTVLTPSSKTEA